jgi:hypothetical protein
VEIRGRQNLAYVVVWMLATSGCIAGFLLTRAAWTLGLWLGVWVALGVYRYGPKTMLGAFRESNALGSPSKYEDVGPKH